MFSRFMNCCYRLLGTISDINFRMAMDALSNKQCLWKSQKKNASWSFIHKHEFRKVCVQEVMLPYHFCKHWQIIPVLTALCSWNTMMHYHWVEKQGLGGCGMEDTAVGGHEVGCSPSRLDRWINTAWKNESDFGKD